MNRFARFLFYLLLSSAQLLQAQDVHQLMAAVKRKQESLRSLVYTLDRTDTLVTGTVRHLSGRTQIRLDPQDRLFGFWFRSKQDGVASEVLYDGQVGYQTDDSAKMYTRLRDSTQIRHLLNQAGGRLIMPDLIRLDTLNAVRSSLGQDDRYYYVTLYYADLTEHFVTNRFKRVGIDKTTLLPMSVRTHQETLGKVQDLFYQITSLKLIDGLPPQTFQEPTFLGSYQQQLPITARTKPVYSLLGQTAPAFHLPTLEKDRVASSTLLGKVTLLDFWEVWCGPCLASMPKVEELAQKYAHQGLQVYGITHETNQLAVARKLVQKRSLHFPTLIGNDRLRAAYHLEAIPLYIVIDRQGKIAFIHEGFTTALERRIQQLLVP